jgi:hypothetical protein
MGKDGVEVFHSPMSPRNQRATATTIAKQAPAALSRAALLGGANRQIASQISTLTQQTIQEISRPRDKYKIKDYKELLESEPLSRACVELKSLRAVSSFGEYEHEDKKVQTWVRSNFETMAGTISAIVRELASSLPFGFAVAEINMTSKMYGKAGEWRLDSINPLDPERVSFAGWKGQITHVVYNDSASASGGTKKWIPYKKCLHITNGLGLFGSPYGTPECRRAMPYYRAKNLIFSEMMVAGKNSASGILLAQADSNETVRLLGADNEQVRGANGEVKTVSAVEALGYQLQNLESSGIITTDLKNRVTPLLIPSGDNFWQYSLQLLKKEILLSFLTPSLIWDEGSFSALGNAGISGNHKAILDANIGAVVSQIQDEMLEKVVRWLLVHNFPKSSWSKNFGSFSAQPYNDPNFEATKASNLIAAISSQILPSSDIDVINTLREAVGVAPVDERRNLELLQKQIDMQVMQQNAAAPADPGVDLNAAPAGFSYW